MSEHFGYGEYERKDVEVLLSTWFMRHHFLDTLISKKGFWARDLLRPANFKMLPPEFHEPQNADYTFYLFIKLFFGHNPYNLNFTPELLDTPLKAFFTFLEKRKNKIEKIKKQIVADDRSLKSEDIENIALSVLIPSWKTLKSDKDANHLCFLIEEWAKEYNLNTDWCLDFTLMVLINFNLLISSEIQRFDSKSFEAQKIKLYTHIFDDFRIKSLYRGLNDFHRVNITKNLWRFERIEFPKFTFKYKEFEFPSTTWFPHITRRKEFTRETEKDFSSMVSALTDIYRHGAPKGKAEYISELNDYCDDVEKRLSDIENHKHIFPCFIGYYDIFPFHSSIWIPAEISREKFIDDFIENLRTSIEKFAKLGKDLETLKKDTFGLSLYSYCNRVEKLIPENYSKIPTKYTDDKHFSWLVDFQVPIVKTFREIKNEIDNQARVTVSAVEKGVRKLAKTIGLTLRKAPKTGRPKGAVELKSRHRVKK